MRSLLRHVVGPESRFRRAKTVQTPESPPVIVTPDVTESSPVRMPYDILLFPVVDWHERFQRPQHLSLEFARRGYRVFYFSNLFEPAICLCDPTVVEVAPNVFWMKLPGSISPPDIFQDIPTDLQIAVLENGVRLVRERFKIDSTLSMVDYPFWAPIVRRIPNNVILYDCMDDYTDFGNAGRPARELEDALLQEADVVVCSSRHLQERARRRGRESTLIRNAVNAEHFENRPASLAIQPNGRTVGYWGATAEWTDIDLLTYAARELPDVRFILLGEVLRIDVSELESLPNVEMRGEVPYVSLPEYLHAFDVCILPYRICNYALASDPLKVWEYMSAGKPVVAVRFPEIERLQDFITLTSTKNEFVEGIRRALSEADPEKRENRRKYARANTWSQRCDEMCTAAEPFFPKVSVIILAHDQRRFTEVCIRSIERFSKYSNLEIVVVDNGSTDDTPEFLTRWASTRPHSRLVRSPENVGFSAGNNLGARASSGDYLVFLNNDTFVTEGWVGDGLAHFRAVPRLGLLGPVTNSSGNESVIDIDYQDMNEMAIKARQYTHAHRGQRTCPGVLHWFCVMLPRRVWLEVGELDEEFGLGLFEDDDYTMRVRAAGYETACAEDVFIHHHHSASFGLLSPERYEALFARNRNYYQSKWGPWTPPVFRKEVQAKCSQ